MTGRGRPRKEKSPDSKLGKSRTRPKETKSSPLRRAAFTEEKEKGPKKKDEQTPSHTDEKPSVQTTRKGKATNHFIEETNEQCRSTDSTKLKTCSTEKSAAETKKTKPKTPNDPPKTSQKITKTKTSTCQATFSREHEEKMMTQPETPKGTKETCGIRAKAKDNLSDELTEMQTKIPKVIRKPSVKNAEAKKKGKAQLQDCITEDTAKTQQEDFAEEKKMKPDEAIQKKTETAVEKIAKAPQKKTKMKQDSFEGSIKDRFEEKVDRILHRTLKNLKIKKNDRSFTSEVVNDLTSHVIKHLKQNTSYFKDVEEPLRTGSYYENLKISNPDEFDVMLPIPVDRVDIKPFGSDGAFYSVGLKRGRSPLEKFQEDNILSATKMLEEFRNEVKKCLKECEKWEMTKKKKGCPAVTLTTTVKSVTISLDLVLCLMVKSSWPVFTQDGFKIEQWLGTKVKQEYKRKPYYLVPKYEGKGTEENDGILAKNAWRVSFSHVEKDIMKNHGSEKTCCERSGTRCCRKDCLKLIKHLLHLLKENNPSFNKFCSYHVKTTLFHACCSRTSDTEWRTSDLRSSFQSLLQDFENYLRNRQLYNFFIPSQNLLSGPGDKICENLANCIKEQRDKGFPIFEQENTH